MNKNQVTFGQEAVDGMLKGMNKVVTAVSATLGPDGQYTIISKKGHPLHVTKDGFETAKAIDLKDEMEDAGAKFILSAAMKTVGEVGDATSTTTVLAGAIITEGVKNIAAQANPVKLKKGIEKATVKVVDFINANSEDVNNRYKEIATVSSNNDELLGSLIGEAMDAVTADGIIRVEPSYDGNTTVEVVKGLEFHEGYLSPYLISNKATGMAEYQEPLIFLTEDIINSTREILPVLRLHEREQRPLVIIAGDVTGEAAATVISNYVNNQKKPTKYFNVSMVKAYGQGSERKDLLDDIATITGATVISRALGRKTTDVKLEDLGSAKYVQSNRNKTVIIDGAGEKSLIEEKIEEIRAIKQMTEGEDDHNTEHFRIRLGRLLGGVAIIKLSSQTDVELKEKLDRLEDALYATKAASESGIVAGGGVALLRAKACINLDDFEPGDETTGARIVMQACEAPIRLMAKTSKVNPDTIIEKIENHKNQNYGFNFKDKVYCDMVDTGIIDPAKAETVSLESAASSAVIMLTSNSLITDLDG